jgi:hypothetical protein
MAILPVAITLDDGLPLSAIIKRDHSVRFY